MTLDSGSMAPTQFVVDRPFVMVIRDDKTAALPFLGQITDPVPAGV
jgi:serine protease inhibitor